MKLYSTLLLTSVLFFWGCGEDETNPPKTPDQLVTSTDEHNAQNSLDWAGTYAGKLPCASCVAINVEIILHEDSTYKQTYVYDHGLESDAVISSGTFSWNEAGNTIKLNNAESPNTFFVGENYLAKLDMEGNRITGDLAEKYILRKE